MSEIDERHQAKARVLLVDDSRSVREEIRSVLLAQGFDAVFFEASNGLEGFKLLLEQPMDLVLCDLVMPQFDGLKFLQMRSSRPELADIPVLMLTAIEDMEQKIKILTSGAADYITKPFHHEEIVARARIHLKIKQLQDELKQKNVLLLELSTTDSLTKIYNRRHFMDLARKEFERSERLGFQVSMLIFDVDLFKGINDSLGHLVGDAVLLDICRLAQKTFRHYDIFGRYGGDEFTVLFPQTSLKQASRVSSRFEELVRGLAIPAMEGRTVSISGGVSTKIPGIPNVEKLLKAADQALYKAKEMGRARVVSHG